VVGYPYGPGWYDPFWGPYWGPYWGGPYWGGWGWGGWYSPRVIVVRHR
jgi:outer membrane lipoprotein